MSSSCRHRLSWFLLLSISAWLLALSGHSFAAPEPKESTRLDLTITTSSSVNLDDKQQANPIEIRIYELKNSKTFENADFFSLQSKDKELMGNDLIAVDTYLLRPGEERKIKRKSDNEATAIGVLAGYRDLGKTLWRQVHPIPEAPIAAWYRFFIPSNKLELTILADDKGIKLVPAK